MLANTVPWYNFNNATTLGCKHDFNQRMQFDFNRILHTGYTCVCVRSSQVVRVTMIKVRVECKLKAIFVNFFKVTNHFYRKCSEQ